MRRFLPELIDLIWDRKIDPGKVFDLDLPLEEAAAGYEAMDQRMRSRCSYSRSSAAVALDAQGTFPNTGPRRGAYSGSVARPKAGTEQMRAFDDAAGKHAEEVLLDDVGLVDLRRLRTCTRCGAGRLTSSVLDSTR